MIFKKFGFIVILFLIDKLLQYFQISPRWFNNYADDFLFLPILLSFALWVQQRFVNHDFKFSNKQIITAWIMLSILFEGIYPIFLTSYTSDVLDILVYGLGALIFALFLNHDAENRMV